MSSTSGSRLMRAIVAMSLLVTGITIALSFVTVHAGHLSLEFSPDAGVLLLLIPFAVLVLGAVIASRQPGNPIGWIFAGVALLYCLAFTADAYAALSYDRHAHLPGAAYAAWWDALSGGPVVFSVFVFLFLLFPNGRLLSRRWRIVVWTALVASGGILVAVGFKPGKLTNSQYPAVNPVGLPGAKDLMQAVLGISFALLMVCLVAGAISLVIRFRGSRGEERQQLKWVAGATAVSALLILSGPLFWFDVVPGPVSSVLWPIVFFIAISLIPLSVGAAMLKYRLYDVDFIINRALVYGSLTLSLAILYVGGVVALQGLFRALTGQRSEIAVAIVTLAVAALFNPWRRRLQAFIDRRFYRRRYDATVALTVFSAHLRDEVDLDQLSRKLLAVVQDTVQPSTSSIWLANGGRRQEAP